ncbi:MAG: hypothetical protein ACRD0P_04275 [Stackebrandtia sp.]
MNTPDAPQWWPSLTTGEPAAVPGIEWRRPDDWAPPEESRLGGRTMRDEHTVDLDTAVREGKLLVGTGPATAAGTDAAWYLDPAAPERLWCALGDFYDPRLWIAVEPTMDAMTEVLSSTLLETEPNLVTLTGFYRGILGNREDVRIPNVYTGDLVPLNGPDLDRYATTMRYLDGSSWASSRTEDPRSTVTFETPRDTAAYEQASNVKSQQLGRIPSMTWRTLHSRSYLSFEMHLSALACAAVRYRPSPAGHHAVVERVNAALDLDFPLDLPLDAVGALSCLEFIAAADIEAQLEAPESIDHLASTIAAYTALHHGDLAATTRLRDFARHPDPAVRGIVLVMAGAYDYRYLAEELALAGFDEDPVPHFELLQLNGAEPSVYNAFGERLAEQHPIMVDGGGNPVEVYSDFIGGSPIGADGEASR